MLYNLTIVILTFNSARTINEVVSSCRHLSEKILVVDSYSKDDTVKIARSLGCKVLQHTFKDYSTQRNWAQQKVRTQWVLHLDSDEIISKKLADSIQAAFSKKSDNDGYLMKRLTYFMGKPIRFGHMNPNWHLRLFKVKTGYCEDRLYDQHFIAKGNLARLDGYILDVPKKSVEEWIDNHNRWSTAEAEELLSGNSLCKSLPGKLNKDPRIRKRLIKNNVYYRLPPLVRPFIFFGYSYIVRLGFLDGRAGFIYSILQSFWFRFLVDVKILERKIFIKYARFRR